MGEWMRPPEGNTREIRTGILMAQPELARRLPAVLGGSLTVLLTLAVMRGPVLAGDLVLAGDPARADAVLFWNDQTNRAIQATGADPFMASRALALESIAVLDTMKSLAGAPAFMVRLPAPGDAPAGAAVAGAAYAMLSYLFPARQAALDAALASSLANERASRAAIEGSDRSALAGSGRAVVFGKAVAEAVIAVRDRDGWDAAGSVRTGTEPGQWRPTPPAFLTALRPGWATMVPFAMVRPDQFRPAGPPAPGTPRFIAAVAEIAPLGDARSTVRTAEQTEIAHYWSDAIGSYAPAGHWNAIAANIVAPARSGMAAEAELFAELNVAIADAGIAMADAKYVYWSWRPVTVIRTGGGGSAPRPDWLPLLETPNHPSYVSGHSSFSGAAAVVLTARFGTRPFTFVSASLPGVTRSFTSFQQAADEAALSRLYGGIHFRFDNEDGLVTGRAIGAWTLKVFQRTGEDRGPVIVMDRPARTGGKGAFVSGGFALDNIAPVTVVTARLDGGEPVRLAVDARGRFTLPVQGFTPSGPERVTLTATSVTGRTSSVRTETEIRSSGDVVTVPASVK
jgi:membrane-associated phospholipid phosphatase